MKQRQLHESVFCGALDRTRSFATRWLVIAFTVTAAAGCANDQPSTLVEAAAPAIPGDHSLITQARAGYIVADPAGNEKSYEDQHTGVGETAARVTYGPPGDFTGESNSRAQYGRLSASAVSRGQSLVHPRQSAQANAAFTDTLVVEGAEGLGAVVYKFKLDGAATGSGHAGAHLFLNHAGSPDDELAEEITVSGEFASSPRPVNLGKPFEFRVMLLSDTRLVAGQRAEAACRFEATLQGIQVFDRDMRPISGVRLRSASGKKYNLLAADVVRK
ncbi:MAG: hypothetical protein JSR77_08940 [Planctomycetes bacterium]|nr:hypothetical protein [Planctomycetota bacterium]